MSSPIEQHFSQLIQKAYSLNQSCVSHTEQLTQLLDLKQTSLTRADDDSSFEIEREVEVRTVKSLRFQSCSKDENEKRFVMRVEGGKKSLKWRSLKYCFFPNSTSGLSATISEDQGKWKTMVGTQVPQHNFVDLKGVIQAHELLDSRNKKGVEEVKWFVDGLSRAEKELEDRVEEVKRELGIGERVVKWLNNKIENMKGESKEVIFVLREDEPFVRRLRLEFEVNVSHERAITEFEMFQGLIDQFFEVPQDQSTFKEKLRERKEQEERERLKSFPDSAVIQSEEEKGLIVGWLKASRGQANFKQTSLLFRGSRDGFSSHSFHEKCDLKGPTVVVFQTQTGVKGGGYSHVSWNTSGHWTSDLEQKSFLFSLDKQSVHNLKKGHTAKAIDNNANLGPSFGGGADLELRSNCNINNESYSYPSSYELPNDSHLGGAKYFQVSEYEVWQIL